MSIQVSKSFDNAGEIAKPQSGIASSTALGAGEVNGGGAIRDHLINYNAEVLFNRNRAYGNPTFAIDTNFDVKNTEPIDFMADGVFYTLGDNTSFNTGTAAVIAADCWGICILTHDGTTATLTWASTAMSYATEAAAIAALGKMTTLYPTAGFACLGYVTVLTASGQTWTAGTDALEGGSGGNPSDDTNYYNDPTLNGTFGGYQIGSANGTVITQ